MSVKTPKDAIKSRLLVKQRASGCDRLQLAQPCLGFACVLYLVLDPVVGRGSEASAIAGACRLHYVFVLCHICCAAKFSSNAGYIQVSIAPREDKQPLPDSALSTWCRSAASFLVPRPGASSRACCFFEFSFSFYLCFLIPWGFHACL